MTVAKWADSAQRMHMTPFCLRSCRSTFASRGPVSLISLPTVSNQRQRILYQANLSSSNAAPCLQAAYTAMFGLRRERLLPVPHRL